MRVNHPVSQREFPFPTGETLVSTTDLKGRITHCNPAFVHLSGYAAGELMGQPHNLIRHPDMPEEAFRDLWATIETGLPWTGLVKNRRKDGDHYWVLANVTPLMRDGRPVAYLSVRTEPARAQVEAAEALYATMRDEARAGRLVHVLRGGDVVDGRWPARLARALRPGTHGAFAIGAAVMVGGGVALGGALGGSGWPVMAGAAAAAALASAALAGWASARSEAGLDALLAYANRMAAGDLTQLLSDVRGNAAVRRLARALTQTCVNVRSMVRDARTEVDGMSVSTHEIAAGNHDLSSRTESQASSLQQTAATMEQITGTVRQTAGTAERAKEIAARARGIARGSSEAVATVSRSMLDIQDASNRISEIIRTIDSIAFQTNILALNAAVEAARAGEQGKGFAVVASEVRALAQRSGHAAREIATLIQDSMQKVEAGTRSTQGAQASMSEALQAVEQVDTLIEEIHGGASEQLTGISQINSAIAQLDSITQQNAAMVEQLAASSTGLEARMHTVTSAVRVFRLDGDDAQPAPDAVALRRAARTSRHAAPATDAAAVA
ncbi:MAG: PAS domain-containing protein [Rubrivivax sp.]|nr:PAS domain-containing protein [Rubrivivax sp.]